MFETAQTDIVTLRKFVTLQPPPVAAKWSVATLGKGGGFGPSDTALWAVVSYSEADFAAVSRALKEGGTLPSVSIGTPPAWVLADVDLSRSRHGSEDTLEGIAYTGKPFASNLYATGFALILPDRRVLIRFSSQ